MSRDYSLYNPDNDPEIKPTVLMKYNESTRLTIYSKDWFKQELQCVCGQTLMSWKSTDNKTPIQIVIKSRKITIECQCGKIAEIINNPPVDKRCWCGDSQDTEECSLCNNYYCEKHFDPVLGFGGHCDSCLDKGFN